MIDKINGLRKLAKAAGEDVQITVYSDYIQEVNSKLREKLESKWDEGTDPDDGFQDKCGDLIKQFVMTQGLTTDEIKQSHA